MITHRLTPLLVLTGTVLVSHLLFTNPFWLVADLFVIVNWLDYFKDYKAFQKINLSAQGNTHRLFVNETFQVHFTINNPSQSDFLIQFIPATKSYGEIRRPQMIPLPKQHTKQLSLSPEFSMKAVCSSLEIR